MRAALVGLLALGVSLSGCVEVPFLGHAEALHEDAYLADMEAALQTLSLVFGQADESVRAFQAGWLAAEGAASEFEFLHAQVKEVKADITKASPPAKMEGFHRQLGRGVTLTQQAMDAMQVGFSSGDASYFDLAGDKLTEARKTLDRAIDSL